MRSGYIARIPEIFVVYDEIFHMSGEVWAYERVVVYVPKLFGKVWAYKRVVVYLPKIFGKVWAYT